jgi:hypothetical protein
LNCSAPWPGPRGNRSWWDEGPHQRHAPRTGRDPIMVAVYVFVGVCALIAGAIVMRGGWS